MLIIGSAALAHYKKRTVKDYDVVGFKDQVLGHFDSGKLLKATEYSYLYEHNDVIVDCILADDSPALQAYLNYEGANDDKFHIASLETLLSLKASHVHYAGDNFQKNVEDYSWLWMELGEDKLSEITKLQTQEAIVRLGDIKTPSLNKSVKEFFAQSEGRVDTWFVHDDVHRIMAHYDVPLYEKMQTDLTLAKCEKDLWEQFSHQEKCECVLEEAYVIALERRILPTIYGKEPRVSPNHALKWALMRVCTNLTSGFFRDFACKYYLDIQKFVNKDYYKILLNAIKTGEIVKIK